MRSWQIQQAKAHLEELVRETQIAGPQLITADGHEIAILLSKTEYEKLTGSDQSLAEFIRHSPLFGMDDIDLSRDSSPNGETIDPWAT